MNIINNMGYLIQKKWFRGLFNNRTFCKVNNKWKDLKDFKVGEKITLIDGLWNTQTFCKCGNELVQSQSFIGERFVKDTKQSVYDYKCSFCGLESHYNPDVILGLIRCDKNGGFFKLRVDFSKQ